MYGPRVLKIIKTHIIMYSFFYLNPLLSNNVEKPDLPRFISIIPLATSTLQS